MQYAPGFKYVELLKKYELAKKELIQNRFVHSEIDQDAKDTKRLELAIEIEEFEDHLANDISEDDAKKTTRVISEAEYLDVVRKYEISQKELIKQRFLDDKIDFGVKEVKMADLEGEIRTLMGKVFSKENDTTKEESESFLCPYCGNKMTMEFIEKARYRYVPMGPSIWYACHSCGSKSPSIFLDEKLLDEGKVKAAVEREIEKARNNYEDEEKEDMIYD